LVTGKFHNLSLYTAYTVCAINLFKITTEYEHNPCVFTDRVTHPKKRPLIIYSTFRRCPLWVFVRTLILLPFQ